MQIVHWGTFSKGQIKEWESTAITVPVKRKLVTSILNPATEVAQTNAERRTFWSNPGQNIIVFMKLLIKSPENGVLLTLTKSLRILKYTEDTLILYK